MSYASDRAIELGIDDARSHRPEDAQRFHEAHPHFRFWFGALVTKHVQRDLSDAQVRAKVLAEMGNRRHG